jgi:hypothetical protein
MITLMVWMVLSSLIPNNFLCWFVQYMYVEGCVAHNLFYHFDP